MALLEGLPETPGHPSDKKGLWFLLPLPIQTSRRYLEISEIIQLIIELETLPLSTTPTVTHLSIPPQIFLVGRWKGSSSPLQLLLTCCRNKNRNEDFGHHHGNQQSLWLPLIHAPPSTLPLLPPSHVSN